MLRLIKKYIPIIALFFLLILIVLIYMELISSMQKPENIIIIDTSLSMSVADEDGETRLKQAQTQALNLISKNLVPTALVECHSFGILRVPYTLDQNTLSTEIKYLSYDHLQPTTTNLSKCLHFVSAFTHIPRNVFLFSDGEDHFQSDNKETFPFKIYVFPLGKEKKIPVPGSEYFSQADHSFLKNLAYQNGGNVLYSAKQLQTKEFGSYSLIIFLGILLFYNFFKNCIPYLLVIIIPIMASGCAQEEFFIKYQESLDAYQSGHYEESFNKLKDIDVYILDNEVLYNAGNIAYKNEHYINAIHYWREYLKKLPKNTDALYNIGNGYFKLFKQSKSEEDYFAASEYYQNVLQITPKHEKSSHNLNLLKKLYQENRNSEQKKKVFIDKEVEKEKSIRNYMQKVLLEEDSLRPYLKKVKTVSDTERKPFQETFMKPW